MLNAEAGPPSTRRRSCRPIAAGGPSPHLLATNGFHTRRAQWIFAEVLGSQAATIVPISVPTDEFDEELWWRSERGFAAVAGECMKLGFYRLRYGSVGYLAAAAALLWLGWRAFRRKQLVANSLGWWYNGGLGGHGLLSAPMALISLQPFLEPL